MQAFDEFYSRHVQTTYSLILRIVRDRNMADDIAQETFWQVWKKAADYKGEGHVAAWLYRLARNKSLDALRRQKSRRDQPTERDLETVWHTAEAEGTAPQAVAPGGAERVYGNVAAIDVEEQIFADLHRTEIQNALRTIPPEQRLCLELAYFEGMSQQQIADHTQLPLGTVKTRIRMGMAKLAHILRGLGYNE